MQKSKAVFNGAVVLYFVIALEFLIMISPFAGFFYAVFNPLLVAADRYPATRWLSAFLIAASASTVVGTKTTVSVGSMRGVQKSGDCGL